MSGIRGNCIAGWLNAAILSGSILFACLTCERVERHSTVLRKNIIPSHHRPVFRGMIYVPEKYVLELSDGKRLPVSPDEYGRTRAGDTVAYRAVGCFCKDE
jgi:hypothetical protein